MEDTKIRDYIYGLEKEYRDLENRGVKTLDIKAIIFDLQRVRLQSDTYGESVFQSRGGSKDVRRLRAAAGVC